MAQQTIAQIKAFLAANFQTGVPNNITAANLRALITNMLDSYLHDIVINEVTTLTAINNTVADNTLYVFDHTSAINVSLAAGSTFHEGFVVWLFNRTGNGLGIDPTNPDTINGEQSSFGIPNINTGGLLIYIGSNQWRYLAVFNDLANVVDRTFPIMDTAGHLTSSSLREADDRLISDKSIQVPPGSLLVGPETYIGGAIRAVSLRSGITNNTALILAQLYDSSTGFGNAFVYSGGPSQNVPLNDPPGVATADTAQFSMAASQDELIVGAVVATQLLSQTVPFQIAIRTTSHSGPVAFQLAGQVTTDASGNATVSLADDNNPILIDSGTTLYVTINASQMLGSTASGSFVPNMTVVVIPVTRNNIALAANQITQSERDLLTNIDERIRDTIGATLVAGANVSIVVDDAANTITISSTGTGGTPPPAAADIIYYGLMDTNIPATVNVATLTEEQDPTSPDTISTGVATAGQYFVILVPAAHALTSIFDTVLQQDVTNIFTLSENVRTLNSELYHSYVIGPLNAGTDETYVINF